MVKVGLKFDVEEKRLIERAQDLNRWVEKCVGAAGSCQKLVEANGIHRTVLESTNQSVPNLLEDIFALWNTPWKLF